MGWLISNGIAIAQWSAFIKPKTFDEGKTARISWDMVHPSMHGKGIGRRLTEFRINEIKKNHSIEKIVVRTTQLVHRFYQKQGFELELTEKDFWAKGLDLYQMKQEIRTR